MNGSVIPILEKPKHDIIKTKCEDYLEVFKNGDKLTNLECDIEKKYLSAKLDKYKRYKMRKSTRYLVRWTFSDLNRL